MSIILRPQLFVGSKEPKQELMNPIQNHHVKANGGIWTSTFINPEEGSAWIKWCIANDFNVPDAWTGWLLYPKQDANLLVIDSLEDMHFAFDKYGYYLVEGSKYQQIDYTKMQQDYDGIHMTEQGEWLTRHGFDFRSPTPFDPNAPLRSFYGYDIESTHWFTWCFEKVEPVKLSIK